jgi:hypothetical protein
MSSYDCLPQKGDGPLKSLIFFLLTSFVLVTPEEPVLFGKIPDLIWQGSGFPN